jgi:hypothetical protein
MLSNIKVSPRKYAKHRKEVKGISEKDIDKVKQFMDFFWDNLNHVEAPKTK